MQIQLPNRQWGLAEFCVDGQCLATEALASGDVMVELGDEPAEYSYRVRVVKPDGTEILREGTAATRPFRGNGAECNPLTANAVLIVNANGDVSVDSP